MFEHYSLSLAALLLMLATMMVQTLVAMVAHRKQAHYVPGIVDDALSHDSFVFRSHRTYQNSLENVPMMALSLLAAMAAGLNPFILGVIAWIFALARIIHMALYYAIATERNPSPRSYFFLIGLLCNLVLLMLMAMTLLS
ncbi:MAPEG family protein [Ferrimonas futtsuensis]|uniref:MAPEG family protein n=1 Tax=Ferrimonas futtsuensis TaxID=364764 RepID=UPI000425CE37|nr:MAPEG family protein [Ferrimonas futtsuensis]